MRTSAALLPASLLFLIVACGEDRPSMNAEGTTGHGEDDGPDDGEADDDGKAEETSGPADDGVSGDADAGDHGDDDRHADADGGDAGDADGGDAGEGGDDGAHDTWGPADGGDGGDKGDGGAHDTWAPADGGDDGGADGWDHPDTGGDGGKPCDSASVPFLAGQSHLAGWLDVATDDDGVHVELQTHAPWTLQLVHVYVGVDAPPQTDGGLTPGQFPYIEPLDSASEYELVVPWDLVGGACGETVHVAVHAEVAKTAGGMTFVKETAWGQGTWSDGSNWSSWLDVTICCD